ncbi:hypothetical protein KW787_02955 [Candidatus Pacearchaeota archaeon]|nr:hypothetical protein [Candidatus Pacearchaeota archaeon]
MRLRNILLGAILVIFALHVASSTITGRATSQPTTITIQVIASPPSLAITSPRNETYITNNSILLNFSASGQDSLWYNLDNTNNITLTSYLYFNTSQGSHTLYIFANNSEGMVTKNVTFSINSTKFTVFYENYKTATRGSSTDFITYTYEQLQNLTNIVLEDTRYGKVSFSQQINVTNSETASLMVTNLDNNTNVSSNRISINATALPNFNTSATISLYGLTSTTPRILRDGAVCSLCTQVSYQSGTLIFTVPDASVYTTEETPVSAGGGGGSSGGSSGGGGGSSSIIEKITRGISVDPEQISVSLKQGETTRKTIQIYNKGPASEHIKINTTRLTDLVISSQKTIEVGPHQTVTVPFDFIAREDLSPGPYLGKITLSSEAGEQEVLVIVDVQSKQPLFDIKAEILKSSLSINPGEDVVAQITLYNLGTVGRIDTQIDYTILNSEGKVVMTDHETLAVETQTSFVKKFMLPQSISPGTYILNVKAIYGETAASASTWFFVGKEIPFGELILYIILGIITLAVAIFNKLRSLRRKRHPPISEIELVNTGLAGIK